MTEDGYLSRSIGETLVRLIGFAVIDLPRNVEHELQKALENETAEIAKEQLKAILKNIQVARKKHVPMCQDTGILMFHLRVGEDFPLKAGLRELITESVREATSRALLRPNAVHPLNRTNSGDNTGSGVPFLELELVQGDTLEVEVYPKGAGSENMSALRMLNPGEGIKGLKRFVLETVVGSGGKPCPPTVIGIGVGLCADGVMKLARKASMRPLPHRSKDPTVEALERELLSMVNETGIGPMGLGGRTTALTVNIETGYTHTAELPVGIIFQCWAARRGSARIHASGRAEYLSHEV